MLTIDSLAGVAKPEYVLRPHQIARRLWVEALPKKFQFTRVWLPWSYPLIVNPAESIGWAIYSRGIYEMPLTEALWRLAQPGDIVVDGGANIGYATSILAARVGPRGKVHSFEPDPRSFGEPQRNVIEWEERGQRGAFVLAHRGARRPLRYCNASDSGFVLNGMVEGPASRIAPPKKRPYQNWTAESRNLR